MRKLIFIFSGLLVLMGSVGTYWYTHNYLPLQQARAKIALAKADHPVKEHKPIVVLIASYNNAAYCERNLRSVFEQTYDNYRVIYIDDCSKDNTYPRVLELVKAYNQEHRFIVIHNEQRIGAMANLYRGIHMCEPHEIVAILDGDDAFAHEKVLERINQVYANPHVWLTYGQAISYPKYKERFACRVPAIVVANHSYRTWDSGQWAFDHLRTFYAALFHKIKEEDFKKDGKFFDMTYDVAMSLPMMEMAGYHHRFIPEILYLYNCQNPISDGTVNAKHQAELAHYIRSLPPYAPLPYLFKEDHVIGHSTTP